MIKISYMRYLILFFNLFILVSYTISQSTRDTGIYTTYPAGFYHKVILQDLDGKANPNYISSPQFKVDFQNKSYPCNIEDYTIHYHSLPVSQGRSGTCWAYSAISFMESEIYRINKTKIKLSEIYIVYWEYIDRATDFIRTRGETYLGEGSETNAILRIMRNHGLMPYSIYTGLTKGHDFNDHEKLFNEYSTYLNSLSKETTWDEQEILNHVKSILNKYINTPPEQFTYKGKKYDGKTFMTDFLKISPGKYFSFMSSKEFTYNSKQELVEDDNWWHCKDYYNISLVDFMNLIDSAITHSYTISICGDVSEPGYDALSEVAIIPSFDIPSDYINEDARQLRLTNKSTTDDHCIHIVGYKKIDNTFWYLIKDSGAGAFDGKNKGYRFYHADYIKLKTMNILLHVDAARIVLDKIIK